MVAREVAQGVAREVAQGVVRGPSGVGLGVWGDSLADQADLDTTATMVRYFGNNWVQAGLHIAEHPIDMVEVNGHPGLRTDQIIPLFGFDTNPRYILLAAGTNNLIQGYTADSIAADFETMVSLCKGIGSTPVLTTVPCGETISGNASYRAEWLDLNAQLRAMGTAQNIPCLDFEQVYVDPATVGSTYAPLAGYTDGTVHPANKGSIKVGEALADWLATISARNFAAGITNLAANPTMTGTGGTLNGATGQAPDGCVVSKSAGATVASSVIARNDGGPGNWWQAVASGSSTDFMSLILDAAGVAASSGETFRCMVDVEVDSPVNMLYVSLKLRFIGSSGVIWSESFTPSSTAGTMLDPYPTMRFRVPEIEVPAGTTSVQPYLVFTAISASWSVTARVGDLLLGKVATT